MEADAPGRDLVGLEVVDRVATITLDSPANRNALSRRLLWQLAQRLEEARADPEVRGVVLTATGTTFCSGADLSDPPRDGPGGDVTIPMVLSTMLEFPKVIIARVNGHVRAGGIGIVCASDIVVAPSTASFAFSEVRIGVAPAIIAVVCVRRMHPRALARYMLTGEQFDGDDAVAAGLATIAVAQGDLDSAVEAMLQSVRLAEPNAVRATKELLLRLPEQSLAAGFTDAEHISHQLFASAEAREGMQAFREKRPPTWARAPE